MTASRRPQTATYSDGPGFRESVRHDEKPTLSIKRSACAAVSMWPAPSRCHRASRYSSISSGKAGMLLVIMNRVAALLFVGVLGLLPAFAQSKTAWGDPDIEGVFTNATITPLERPAEF